MEDKNVMIWRKFMSNVCRGDYKEEKEYSLLGMVCHTGGVDSGHYTAFIRKDKEVNIFAKNNSEFVSGICVMIVK